MAEFLRGIFLIILSFILLAVGTSARLHAFMGSTVAMILEVLFFVGFAVCLILGFYYIYLGVRDIAGI